MKASAIISLAVLLILGPVAWTVDACLDGHPNHVFEQVSAQNDQDDDDATVPSIHCVAWEQQFGAALRSAAAAINRSDEVSRVDIASLDNGARAVLANNLWMEALFKRSGDFAYLPVLSHVFLSVFLI